MGSVYHGSFDKIRAKIKRMRLHRLTTQSIIEIAEMLKEMLQGWFAYFKNWGVYNGIHFFFRLNKRIMNWCANRYKRFKRNKGRIKGYLRKIQSNIPNLFVHWKYGFRFGKANVGSL